LETADWWSRCRSASLEPLSGRRSVRILQVHTRYRQRGGEDAVADAEADLLGAAGHEVERFILSNPGGAKGAAALAAAPWNPAAARAVDRVARRVKPDIVHIHNTWFSMSPSVVVAASDHAPVVMTLHNYRLTCANGLLFRDGAVCRECVDGSVWNGLRHLCYRGPVGSLVAAATLAWHRSRDTWGRHVTLFSVLTRFALQVFLDAGLPVDRLRVRPNFTADPGPRPAPPSMSRALLYAGRLTPEKGLPTLLEAWRVASPEGLELEVAGSGPLAPSVRGDGVRYLGPLEPSDLRRKLLSARALLVPSIWYEGMPMIVLEAFAAGLPVVATRVGSLTEMVESLGEDWLVAPEPEAWAFALGSLARDPAVDRASATARELFEARYEPSRALEALETLYAEGRRLSLR
jgi:glycosyltransferase involved in cell wall biosynthesis